MATAVALTGSDQLVIDAAGRGVRYRGFSVRNTSSSATALLRIFDNTAASGTPLEEIALAASESAREFYPIDGAITAIKGVFVQVVSGSVAGSVRVG